MRRAGAAPRAALGVFAIRVAAAAFAYGAQVVMARLMGGGEYGIFAATWVWIAILGHASTLGFSQGACRFIPADQALGDHEAVRGFLVCGAVASAFGGLGIAILGVAGAALEGSLLGGVYAAPVLAAALVLPVFALQDYLEGVARSQNWAVLAIAPPYLLRQALIMAAMVAAVASGAPAEAWVAIACTLAATGIVVVVQAVWLILRLRRVVGPGASTYRWPIWTRACLAIAAGDLATAALSVVDVVALSLLVAPTTVGLYFAATRIQQFVAFVPYAATAATAQRFAALSAAGEREALQRLVRAQSRLTLAGTALVGGGLVVVSPWLLGLLGPGFDDGVPILAVLAAGSVAAGLFGPGEHLLTMLGGERLRAGITLAALVLAAASCAIAIPACGVIGAACAIAVVGTGRAAAMAMAAGSLHGLAAPVVAMPRLVRIAR